MRVQYDYTQRNFEVVLRTGVDGEEDQGIFINEDPHKWNVVHKCTLGSCPLFYTETAGKCSCARSCNAVGTPLQSPSAFVSSLLTSRPATSSATTKFAKGDVVSVSPCIFDGAVPGSFSRWHPERCYGSVEAVHHSGLATVKWENGDLNKVKLSDLKSERNHTLQHAIN